MLWLYFFLTIILGILVSIYLLRLLARAEDTHDALINGTKKESVKTNE